MGAKSRSNYALAQGLTNEEWEELFSPRPESEVSEEHPTDYYNDRTEYFKDGC